MPEVHSPPLDVEPSPAVGALHAALYDVARYFVEEVGLRTLVIEGPADNPGLIGVWLDGFDTTEQARAAAAADTRERIGELFAAACEMRDGQRDPWSFTPEWRGSASWSWLLQLELLAVPGALVASIEDALHYRNRMYRLEAAQCKMLEVRSGRLLVDYPPAPTLARLRESASRGDAAAAKALARLRDGHAAEQHELRRVAILECNEVVAERLAKIESSALVCYGAAHVDDLVARLLSHGCGVAVWHDPAVWTDYLKERGASWSHDEVFSPDAEYRHDLSHFGVPGGSR